MADNQRLLCLATCLEPMTQELTFFWNQLAESLGRLDTDLLIITADSQPQGLTPAFLTLPASYQEFSGLTRTTPDLKSLSSPEEVQRLIDIDSRDESADRTVSLNGYYVFDALLRVLNQTLRPAFVLLKDDCSALNRHCRQLMDRLGIPAYFLNSGFLPYTFSLDKSSCDSISTDGLRASIESTSNGQALSVYQSRDYLYSAWQVTSRPQQGDHFRDRYGLNHGERIIAFFGSQPKRDHLRKQVGQGDFRTTRQALLQLESALENFAGFRLIFIPDHRDWNRYQDEPAFQRIAVVRDEAEAVIFHHSDVIAGMDNETILRALLLDKPALKLGYDAALESCKSAYQVDRAEHVAAELGKIFSGETQLLRQQNGSRLALLAALNLVSLQQKSNSLPGIDAFAEFIAANGRALASNSSLEERWVSFQTGFEMLVNDAEGVIYRLMGLKAPAVAEPQLQIQGSSVDAVSGTTAPLNSRLDSAYSIWREKTVYTEARQQVELERAAREWHFYPSFHLITICQQGQQERLAATLASLQQQSYQAFGLTVIANFPCPMAEFDQDERLEWRLIGNHTFVDLLNICVAESETDWVALIDCGDLAEPNLVFALSDECNKHPEWRVLYVDDDIISEAGEFTSCHFRPDFNLDLFYSRYYFGGLCAFRRDTFLEAGGFRSYPGAENYDLGLRILEKYGETVFGHVDELVYHQLEANRQLYLSELVEDNYQVVLREYFARRNIPVKVRAGLLPCSHMVEFEHAGRPLVSIVIPTKDRLDLIKPCLDSVLKRTDYPNYEIIVMDNQSSEQDVLDYLDSVPMLHRKVRVIRYDHPYNYSAINNCAVEQALGEYIVLLNNDTVVIQDNWLSRMMSHAQRPEVGVVGARLMYPNQTVQHAGVVLGFGPADHLHIGASLHEPGYMGRAQLVQNFSAVTAACLLIRKSVFDAVDGLDEKIFKVLYNDVDLCLKVTKAGYKIVWTPFATLIHHGSSSLKNKVDGDQSRKSEDKKALDADYRKFIDSENASMFRKWLPLLSHDTGFNRHLGLKFLNPPQPETEMVPQWNAKNRELPRVMASRLLGATAQYRIRIPVDALSRQGKIYSCFTREISEVSLNLPEVSELARLAPDSMLFQSFGHEHQLFFMQLYRKFMPELFMVYELDDLKSEMPAKNPISRTMFKDFRRRLRAALDLCDRFIVTSEPLKAAYEDLIDDIRVIPNYLPGNIWGQLKPLRGCGSKPRVGWAGAMQHQGDLEVIVDVVKQTADEVDWVFFGMCPDEIRPYIREFHGPVEMALYPQKLASLNLDLAVAPLEYHRFNEAKSSLRVIEFGALGWPVIASDIYPYQLNAPGVWLVRNNTKAWVDAIRERVHDLKATALAGDQLRLWVQNDWFIEQHLDEWYDALVPESAAIRRVMQDPRRKTG